MTPKLKSVMSSAVTFIGICRPSSYQNLSFETGCSSLLWVAFNFSYRYMLWLQNWNLYWALLLPSLVFVGPLPLKIYHLKLDVVIHYEHPCYYISFWLFERIICGNKIILYWLTYDLQHNLNVFIQTSSSVSSVLLFILKKNLTIAYIFIFWICVAYITQIINKNKS